MGSEQILAAHGRCGPVRGACLLKKWSCTVLHARRPQSARQSQGSWRGCFAASRAVDARVANTMSRQESADAQAPEEQATGVAKDGPLAAAPTGWHPLTQPLLWQGSEEDALQPGAPPGGLAPAWRVMLLSDGSVTRHLQLLTGLRVEVECLEMQNIGSAAAGLPAATSLIPGPLVQRQVFLRSPEHAASGKGQVLVYAASWWSAEEVDAYLADKALPIWASLSAARTELYRDIQSVFYGSSPFLQRQFGLPGPFWGRQYLFWHEGRPLTLIHEIFSPALQRYLGPINPDTQ